MKGIVRRTTLLIATIIASATVCSQPTVAQSVSTQQERTQIKISPQPPQKQGKVVKITGKNVSSTVPPLRVPSQLKMPMVIDLSKLQKPAPISAPMKLQMIGGKGAIGSYATLSLKNPSVAGKAEISLWSPLFISTGEDGTPLTLFGASLGYLTVRINAESANSLYLVDCAVSTTAITSGAVTTFSVTELGSAEAQHVSVKNGHVVFLLDAPAAGWYEHLINNENVGWVFYSCNVSSLK